MAQKKVILKDGTDELLPKTSASMVFTESGQTVESALKNAGGGGTGDSGIADITSIYSKMNIQNGGILGSDDLATLKGYMEAGKVLKMAMVGATLTFSYNTSGTLIALSSSPMVSPSMYGAMIVFSLLIDSETGEYVGVTDEGSGHLVQQMIPSSVTATQLCTMNGYTKPSAYSALAPTDTLNVALGKLEAGIGSGGTGGGDDTYYLSSDVDSLDADSSHENILAALGGSLDDIIAAIGNKRIAITYVLIGFIGRSFPVSASRVGNTIVNLSYYSAYERTLKEIICNTSDTNQSIVKIMYPHGYPLNVEVCSLTSSSDTDTISTAVGGESGMKKIIKAINDGNRLVVRDVSSKRNQDFLCSFCEKHVNGNMNIILSGIGYGLWGGIGGLLSISYNKTSNTFSCTLVPISMGS